MGLVTVTLADRCTSDSPPWESQLREWESQHAARSQRVAWPWRVAWGLTWRYSVLGAVAVYAGAVAARPWAAIAAGAAAGMVLGLYRRRWLLARLWRTAVVAVVAVYVAPLVALYPTILATSIGALTAAPLLATWRRR